MSLKSFHILFVSISTLLAFGFAAWCFNVYTSSHSILHLMTSMGSIAGGILLLVYGKSFLEKIKKLQNSSH